MINDRGRRARSCHLCDADLFESSWVLKEHLENFHNCSDVQLYDHIPMHRYAEKHDKQLRQQQDGHDAAHLSTSGSGHVLYLFLETLNY